MSIPPSERCIPVYKLLPHKTILKQLLSFSAEIVKCNFTTVYGWKGKLYVDKHEVDQVQPFLRGVDMLDIHYLKLTDTVILTEEQYNDYKIILAQD